jgi:hypothetical protein
VLIVLCSCEQIKTIDLLTLSWSVNGRWIVCMSTELLFSKMLGFVLVIFKSVPYQIYLMTELQEHWGQRDILFASL